MHEIENFKSFLALSTEKRAVYLQRAKKALTRHVGCIKPDFSLMLYGSSVYGFNPELDEVKGNYDDLDCIGIIPKPSTVGYSEFVQQVSFIFDSAVLPTARHFGQFRNGKVDIVRVSGTFNNLPIGMHTYNEKAIRTSAGIFGIDKPLRNMLPHKDKYTEKVYKEYLLGNSGSLEFPADFETIDGTDDEWRIVSKQYFSRKVNGAFEGNDSYTIGLLTDKFLTSDLVYETKHSDIRRIKSILWLNFVRSCLYYSPEMTNEEMINLFVRAERFSPYFRKQLERKIQVEKNVLAKRLATKPQRQ